MQIYLERQQKQMQVITEKVLSGFLSVKIFLARGDAYENGILLYDGLPAQVFVFPFTFSTNAIGDVYIVGYKTGYSELIDSAPLFNNVQGNDPTMLFEANKVQIQRARALSLAGEDVTLYLLQTNNLASNTKCVCFDDDYELPNKNCNICGGSGFTNNYLGITTKIKIPDMTSWQFEYKESGEVVIKQIPNCWCGAWPYLGSKDIVERKNGEMYKIQKISDENINGAGMLIGQDFNLVSFQDYQNFKFSKVVYKHYKVV